ncbi:response regulator transcription factor [Desulfosporosinus youngiae]|uniref:Stage 0 sporulation protein A homolog n=1 Tax=Desulfosporosinus youngiae DSM 17734 TaxID=768710 RepID=H5Y2T7_9FIRM|nr:response regulator transcription factor [Desulfosporosinus youngiae]EHQ88494.1 response regulator containing a CheY-like receiver domain and an HTH DNA-binding domain [Desulfosporosinus youngiae DSM 17734]
MKVLIVDDDALIREGLKILLEIEDDFQVVGTASNGHEALEMCRKEKPELVLMDIRMPVMDGVLGTKLIKSQFREIKIVILTTFKDDEYIKEALKSGAEGYILKNQPADSIIESLRTVGKGNIVLEREVANTLSSMLKESKKATPERLNISPREFEILKLVGEGLSNREIAESLNISEGTTRNYVTGLLEKLGFRDRTQLAIFFIRNCE